jgi:hypothetical protein
MGSPEIHALVFSHCCLKLVTYNLNMVDLGKLLLVIGAVIIVVGVVLVIAGRLNLPIGRLPGDIVYRGKNTTVYFPLATSIILSILLSLIFWLVSRSRH